MSLLHQAVTGGKFSTKLLSLLHQQVTGESLVLNFSDSSASGNPSLPSVSYAMHSGSRSHMSHVLNAQQVPAENTSLHSALKSRNRDDDHPTALPGFKASGVLYRSSSQSSAMAPPRRLNTHRIGGHRAEIRAPPRGYLALNSLALCAYGIVVSCSQLEVER